MGYDLRLYASERSVGSNRLCIGHFKFTAGDDLAAVKHARKAYASAIGNCEHVVLLNDRGKEVWQIAARDFHEEGAGFMEERPRRFG